MQGWSSVPRKEEVVVARSTPSPMRWIWRLCCFHRSAAGSGGAGCAGRRSSLDGGDRDGSCALRDKDFDDDELLRDDGEGICNSDVGACVAAGVADGRDFCTIAIGRCRLL
uniref:Uncharacterized protein n=1 Tax=Arundo donax TaxID=35708 RepID=A0A0A9C2E8_ARUDO